MPLLHVHSKYVCVLGDLALTDWKLELDNISPMPPYDKGHLTRCVLMYTCGVFLRIKGLVRRILHVVETTARQLSAEIRELHQSKQPGTILPHFGFTDDHLLHALDLIYGQPSQEVMKPMRMVMAAVIDNTFLWLLLQPYVKKRIAKEPWTTHMERFSRDIIEYRDFKASSPDGSVVADDETLKQLFNREEVRNQTSKAMVL